MSTDADVEKIKTYLEDQGIGDNSDTKTSNIEDLAAKYGWKPEKGERTAEEFIEYALKKLPERGDALAKMKSTIDEMASHMRKQKELGYKQALADLEAQRREAISLGDVELVEQIEKQKQDLKPELHQELEHPAIQSFKAKYDTIMNSTDFDAMEIKSWILKHDNELALHKLPIEEHMKKLDEHVQRKFKSYFNDTIEDDSPTNSVESNIRTGVVGKSRSSKSFSLKDLSPEQQQVAKYLEQSGAMKIDAYIKQLVENGDLNDK